jgi:hypothetical protein
MGQRAAETIKRENEVHLRQLAKKSTCLVFIFLSFLVFFTEFVLRFPPRGFQKCH